LNDKIKEDEMGRAWGTHGEQNGCKILVGQLDGKKRLGRSRRRWEDNIKMDFIQIDLGGMDWIHLAQDRDQGRALVNKVMNLRVP
jgi:hypothetical protein